MPRLEQLSAHDETVLRELVAWRSPRSTRFGRGAGRVEALVDRAMSHVPMRLVEQVLGWVLPRTRELTWRATSRLLVLRAYRRAGYRVEDIGDISDLELEVVDEVAGDKRLHEGAVAGIEGAATGFFGGFMLAADIAAVMVLSIRAVQSRALVYGFDPADERELAFVLSVLDEASRLGPTSKQTARRGVAEIGVRMAEREFVERAAKQVVGRIPETLATRLAAMKSESAAPVIGAFTSGAFNGWYLQRVTRAAHMAYRERFLRRKYGDDLLTAYGL